MGFFDELGKSLQQKGQAAIKATKDATETLTLKSQISSEKSAIQSNYQQIGELAYSSKLTASSEMYDAFFHAIKASEDKIISLQEEIANIEGAKLCTNCQAKLPMGAKACPQCGTFVVEPVPSVEAPVEVVTEQVVEPVAEVSTETPEV